jgi:hypothetical protein
VRFFHPSDEAAAADWDLIAVEGARRAVQGKTQAALLAALRETFEPLAPTILIYRELAPPPPARPPGTGPVLAWQHEGFGFGVLGNPYRSQRIGRPPSVTVERVGSPPQTRREDLFDERPAPGETFERPLGAGLACRVVLGLPATAPPPPGATRPHRPLPGADDPAVRAAAVVVAWNVFRHFYPYHDVIKEDWNAVLDDAIADVLDDRGPEDLYLTLRRLVHHLHDGHGRVSGPTANSAFLPIRLARVEGAYVVLAAPPASGLTRGDELVSIDGVPIGDLHERRRTLHSGSPQWIDYLLLAWGAISEGPNGSAATIELRRRGAPRRVTATRSLVPAPPEFDRPPIEELAGGIFYIDLDRATDAELGARLAEIAKAPGVVFDLRGYPKSSPDWLAHLLTRPDKARWMFMPRFIHPDGHPAAFSQHGWDMQPVQPHIAGSVAFITGPGAISYAESVMGMVEGYRLGAIVGAPTAGTNGNINPFAVPGGLRIIFTGMKVTRLDGRQHHLIGVQPTHPVSRTLAGIRAGRDEELEAALALVRPGSPRDRK